MIAARNEWRLRTRSPFLWVALPVALAAASIAVLTPVWLNGDPQTLGSSGGLNGGFVGTGVGVAVALSILMLLLGADLDRGRFPERLRHGQNPRLISVAQGFVAGLAGVGACLLTSVAAGLGSLGDAAFRDLTDHPATQVMQPWYLGTVTALSPVIIAGVVAVAWCALICAASGIRAVLATSLAMASFVVLLLAPESGMWFAAHPLAGAWRLLSATEMGESLPGARADNPIPYAVSAAGWIAALTALTAARFRSLGRDRGDA